MIDTFRDIEPVAGYALYRAHLGITVTALAHVTDQSVSPALLGHVAAEAAETGDGYAARTVLDHRIPGARLPARQCRALNGLVTTSGLASGPLPPALRETFANAIFTASKALSASLKL